MEDRTFESAADIWEALLAGQKIRCKFRAVFNYLHLVDNILVDDRGFTKEFAFYRPIDWELYEEPKLNLTIDDVGKKVKLRNGSVHIIDGWCITAPQPVQVNGRYYSTEGAWSTGKEECAMDIIEILN